MSLSTSARRSTGTLAVLGSAVLGAALVAAPAAQAGTSGYAPADTARIHPGTMMYTDGAQCTANFVYTDASANTYVGYAAHCAGLGEATDTDGCQAASLPLGTKVSFIEGGSLVDEGTQVGTGTLVYSSWLTETSSAPPTPTPAPTTTSRWSRSTPRTSQGQPLDPVLGRPDRHRHRRHRRRRRASTPTATPACAPASRRSRRTAA